MPGMAVAVDHHRTAGQAVEDGLRPVVLDLVLNAAVAGVVEANFDVACGPEVAACGPDVGAFGPLGSPLNPAAAG